MLKYNKYFAECKALNALHDFRLCQTKYWHCKTIVAISVIVAPNQQWCKKVLKNITLYRWVFVYCCTPKVLYNHVCVGGGGPLLKPPPVCSIHLDDATTAAGQWRQCAHQTATVYMTLIYQMNTNKCLNHLN